MTNHGNFNEIQTICVVNIAALTVGLIVAPFVKNTTRRNLTVFRGHFCKVIKFFFFFQFTESI